MNWSPRPPQREFLAAPEREVNYGGAAGAGKALCVETPIPTPSGWKTMGEIRKGDLVYDERGKPCRVLVAHDVIERPRSFRVTFDDGAFIDACADHRWLTYTAKDLAALTRSDEEWKARRRAARPSRAKGNKSKRFVESISARNTPRPSKLPKGAVRSTIEIRDTLFVGPSGRKNHAIPVALPLEGDRRLVLDPYLLGAWLGDGTTRAGSVTTMDPEILAAFSASFRRGHETENSGRANTYGFLGLRPILRRLGVFGNKHIPPDYLRASAPARLELLRGLMDTDGSASLSGAAEFTTTRQALGEGVLELILSLGWKASLKEARAKIDGRDVGPKWRITFSPTENVFRLPRKAERHRASRRRCTRFRYIESVSEIPAKPMRCLTVDSPSRLYLASKWMIPTHNTDALLVAPLRFINEPDHNAILLRRRLTELTEVTSRAIPLYRALSGRWVKSERTFYFPSGARIRLGYAKSKEDAEQYRGEEFTFVGFEELCQWGDPGAYLSLLSRLRRKKSSRCVLMMRSTCNPEGPGVIWVKKRFGIPASGAASLVVDKESGFVRRFIPGRLADNIHIDREDYARTLRSLGPKRARALLDGRWDSLVGQYFSTFNPAASYHVRPFRVDPWWTFTLGFDHGFKHRTGVVLVGVNGDGFLYVIDVFGRSGYGPARITSEIHAMLERHGLSLENIRTIEAGGDVFAKRDERTTIAQEYHKLGIVLRQAEMARVAGWRRIASLLGDPEPDARPDEILEPIEPRMVIHPRCHLLIESLAAAQFDEKRPEDVAKMDLPADDPDGVSDDELDAFRYAVMRAVRGAGVSSVRVGEGLRKSRTIKAAERPRTKGEILADIEGAVAPYRSEPRPRPKVLPAAALIRKRETAESKEEILARLEALEKEYR